MHTHFVAIAKFHVLGDESVPHPPYSQDLAPSEFYLFPNMKKWLGEKDNGSNDEVCDETNILKCLRNRILWRYKKVEECLTNCTKMKGTFKARYLSNSPRICI